MNQDIKIEQYFAHRRHSFQRTQAFEFLWPSTYLKSVKDCLIKVQKDEATSAVFELMMERIMAKEARPLTSEIVTTENGEKRAKMQEKLKAIAKPMATESIVKIIEACIQK